MSSLFLTSIRRPLEISSWSVFFISLSVYWLTADSGVSFWDCPEYVTTASKLEVGHPPGNPVWTLAMRFLTLPFPAVYHAYIINLGSGLLMAFATFFLCRIIFTILVSAIVGINPGNIPQNGRNYGWNTVKGKAYVPSFIAAGASLCFAFCDSAWYSAVEAEVYAMSAMLMSVMIWLTVEWWWEMDYGRRIRIIVLICYLAGLSTGVHEMNLLVLPVIALVMWSWHIRKSRNSVPDIQGASGIIRNPIARILQPCILGILMFLIGSSAYALIYIRGAAAPPMNEGTPGNFYALKAYINRDQYPKTPLIYGPTPYSRPMLQERISDGIPVYDRYALQKGSPIYLPYQPGARIVSRSGFMTPEDSVYNRQVSDKGSGFIIADYKYNQVLTPELNMWFPRITSRNIGDRAAYADWAGMTEESMDRVSVSDAFDEEGLPVNRMNSDGIRSERYSYRPTYLQNLRFFLSYQLYYMYGRYLLWNFVGRQNDYHSMGEIEHGNFITGIDFIDEAMIGPQSKVPSEIGSENPGRNVYYGIPFMTGIIGLFWLMISALKKKKNSAEPTDKDSNSFPILLLSVGLFIMTGIAIVVYLNQNPGEPRERDYTFLGSFMAFAIWIAAGMSAIKTGLDRLLFSGNLKSVFSNGKKTKLTGVLFCMIISFGIPALMVVENYDDHNRKGRFETSFFAKSLLDYDYPAIIFSQGDNSTFPLWYSQEVEGNGGCHTVVDVTYLNLPAYVDNLLKQQDLSLIATPGDLLYGAYSLIKIPTEGESLPLDNVLGQLYSITEGQPVFPSSSVMFKGYEGDSIEIRLRDFTGGSGYLQFKQLMLLELINAAGKGSGAETIYFPYGVSHSFYRPLSSQLKPALFGWIYAPALSDSVIYSRLADETTREIEKLRVVDFTDHYQDEIVADHTRRYRGALIIAADVLLTKGYTTQAQEIVDMIEMKIPYDQILAGSFTVADSTFYEGEKYIRLSERLHQITGKENYNKIAQRQREQMEKRRKEWLSYYASLSPAQRLLLSPRSLRLLRELKTD